MSRNSNRRKVINIHSSGNTLPKDTLYLGEIAVEYHSDSPKTSRLIIETDQSSTTESSLAVFVTSGAIADYVDSVISAATSGSVISVSAEGALSATGSAAVVIKHNEYLQDTTSEGLKKIIVDKYGHVSAATDVVLGDLTSMGLATSADVTNAIESANTTNNLVITSADGTGNILKSYTFTQGGVQKGVIDIPKDFLVKSAEVKTVTVADEPYSGAAVGDKYIDFVLNTKSGTAEDEHLYVPVNDLVDTYTGSEYIIVNGNVISLNTEALDTHLNLDGKADKNGNATENFSASTFVGNLQGLADSATTASSASSLYNALNFSAKTNTGIEEVVSFDGSSIKTIVFGAQEEDSVYHSRTLYDISTVGDVAYIDVNEINAGTY